MSTLASLSIGLTANGALSNASVGEDRLARCLEYFSKAGTYANRTQDDVDTSMKLIFDDDPAVALLLVFAVRLITRKTNITGIDEAQTGYGRRDEFYKACTWILKNRPDDLYRNLHCIPIFGSWKDLLQPPLITLVDAEKSHELFAANLGEQLLLKYLPQARSKGQDRSERDRARSIWAKRFTRVLGITPKEYRKLKSKGLAHVWQRQMARREWAKINFNGVAGKAMFLATSRKGKDGKTVFERHGQLDRLAAWVETQPAVKFTGYPYELFLKMKGETTVIQTLIYNKQWATLLAPMQAHQLGNVWCAVDTSGSMSLPVVGETPALDICLSMGLALSSLNVGAFKDYVVAFESTSRLIRLTGTPCERAKQLANVAAMGGTNFQSVIDLLVNTRRDRPDIPLGDYPETILVISDMGFNPVDDTVWYSTRNASSPRLLETNQQAAKRKLKSVGLDDVRIIWWNVSQHQGRDWDRVMPRDGGSIQRSAHGEFPAKMDDKGVYLVSGFDPVNLAALMGLSKPVAPQATAKDADAPRDENTIDENTTIDAPEPAEETPLDGLINFLSQPIFTLIK